MRCFLTTFLSLTVVFAFAQDHLYSLKSGNLNHYNPALLGTQSDAGVNLGLRFSEGLINQGHSENSSILVHLTTKKNVGFGLQHIYDLRFPSFSSPWDINRTNVFKLNFNYKIVSKKLTTRVGVNLGYRNSTVELSGSPPHRPVHGENVGFVKPPKYYFDEKISHSFLADLGVVTLYKDFLLGISAMQANQPDISLFVKNPTTYPVRWVGMLGYSKSLGDFTLTNLSVIQHQLDMSTLSSQFTGQYKFVKLNFGARNGTGNHNLGNWWIAGAAVQFDKFQLAYNLDQFVPEKNSTVRSRDFFVHEFSAAWYIKGLKKDDSISNFVNGIL